MKNVIIFILVLFSTILYAQQDTLVRKLVDTKIMADTLGRYWDSTKTAGVSLNNLGTTAINTGLMPAATVTYNLGSASSQWNIMYFDRWKRYSGGYTTTISASTGGADRTINFPNASGIVMLTIDTLSLSDRINTKLTASDTTSLSNRIDTKASTTLNNLTAPTSINASLIPNTHQTYDLGTPTMMWDELYADSWIFRTATGFTTGIGFLSPSANRTIFFQNASGTVMFTGDTTSLSNRINLKLTASDTISLSNRINLKAPIASPTFTGTATAPDFIASTGDIKAGTIGKGLILRSPDGSSFRVTVGNDSVLTTTKLPD